MRVIISDHTPAGDTASSPCLRRSVMAVIGGVLLTWAAVAVGAGVMAVGRLTPRLVIAFDVSTGLAALFLGGAGARLIAGHVRYKGWLGVASALAFWVSMAVWPSRVWYRAVSPEAMAPPGFRGHIVVISDYTVLFWLALGVLGTTLSVLGDLYVAGRLRARKARAPQRPISDADST